MSTVKVKAVRYVLDVLLEQKREGMKTLPYNYRSI